MAGNPFINSIIKKNRQGGDPRFGRFGAGGQAAQQSQYPQGQYQQNPYGAQYSSEPQQYQGGYPQGYGQPEYQNQPGYDQQYAQQPGYSPVIEGERLTMNDVIMKTGLSLAVVVLGAAVGWYMPILLVVGLIGGLVLGLVNGFKRKVSPVLVLAYALAEGLLLGGLSGLLNARYPGIALQAVIATVVVFATLLALFANGKIRATPKLTKIFLGASLGYLAFFVVSWGVSLFTHTSLMNTSVAGLPLGLIVGVFGVALASYSLVLDFTNTTEAVEAGLPERESWRLAFGLTASLVWLYIEILRILMYLASIFSDN